MMKSFYILLGVLSGREREVRWPGTLYAMYVYDKTGQTHRYVNILKLFGYNAPENQKRTTTTASQGSLYFARANTQHTHDGSIKRKFRSFYHLQWMRRFVQFSTLHFSAWQIAWDSPEFHELTIVNSSMCIFTGFYSSTASSLPSSSDSFSLSSFFIGRRWNETRDQNGNKLISAVAENAFFVGFQFFGNERRLVSFW